jgi:hypothetical protein
LTDLFAWMNNDLGPAAEPALLHPQVIADLILGPGFYGGWTVARLLAMRWFRSTLAESLSHLAKIRVARKGRREPATILTSPRPASKMRFLGRTH